MTATIARIERVHFRTTRSGGYDFEEVDTFLTRTIETLAQGYQPGAAPAFTIRRRGYERADVDAFADELRGSADADGGASGSE